MPDTTNRRPAISVIIIAYNAADIISRSIDSVLKQTFTDFELIVIDDGSTDDTKSIVDGYRLKDGRIKSHRQANGGVAAAREKGLELATGTYCLYVDADDWIESDMLDGPYSSAVSNEADMVVCDVWEHNGLGDFYRKQKVGSSDSMEVIKQVVVEIGGVMCNKLIRRGLFDKYGIHFTPGVNYGEDLLLTTTLLSKGITVSYVPKAYYHYDKNANASSITNQNHTHPVGEYDTLLDRIRPVFEGAGLERNFNALAGNILLNLTYAPAGSYAASRTLFNKHRESFLRSGIPFAKKVLCLLFYSGFRSAFVGIRTLRDRLHKAS